MRSDTESLNRPSRARGFTLVESLAALGIFAVAVLIAAAFLQAHVQAARRLEVRSALVRASETTLEEVRGGRRPLAPANIERGREAGLAPGFSVHTNVKIASTGVADLVAVTVTSRSAASGQPMEVSIATMVWRP
jgi:prepilin-type N-terminal cleavage/methylation domain-containing protein